MTSWIYSQDETKKGKYSFNAQEAEVDQASADVFLVSGLFTTKEEGTNRYYEVAALPLDDSIGQVGPSARGSASIQASVLGTKVARSAPRMGVGVHGQNGYRLVLVPVKKTLELWKSEEIVLSQPFKWESDTWYDLKLSVSKLNENEWSIEGKAWKKGETEPAKSQFLYKDQKLRGQGKCSLFATPYSGTPVKFDDITVEVDELK